jgi:aminopeptidase YwaD
MKTLFRRISATPRFGVLFIALLFPISLGAQVTADRSVVPEAIRNAFLLEYSGELAQAHVQLLSVNRMRTLEEYTETFMETRYLEKMAKEYGLSDVQVDFFEGRPSWIPELGELWMVEPVQKKLASLTMVPAALASGSGNADVEAELVYAGAAREADFEGLDVAGKIVLGDASVGAVFGQAVNQLGAVGALGTGSAGVSRNTAGYTLDQIGWASVRPTEPGRGFGFNLSLRQFNELRGMLERGQRVVLKAKVQSRTAVIPMNVISAAIPGTDPDAGELMHVAHAFERPATPGAADNNTGVAVTLEIARTLAELIRRGELPQPRRTIRFLWVPEISGSRAFMYANPELEDRLVAAMNYDMPGEDLEKTDSYLRMKMTPDSRPSYLNDLIADLLRFTDQTEIQTQTGNNAPFNYRLVPFISSSDHIVFLSAGIPAMQFNHWPDNFYHSSADTPEMTDPTEMKRTGFIGGAGFYYLANAGAQEAMDLAWEAAGNGEARMAEVTRQASRLLNAGPGEIHERYMAARNKVYGAFKRASGGVASVLDLDDGQEVQELVNDLNRNLEEVMELNYDRLETAYRVTCGELGVSPERPGQDGSAEYEDMVPVQTHNFYTPEFQAASGRLRSVLPRDLSIPRLAGTEIPWFVDGERSIAEIWRLVRAEFGNVTTGSYEWKYAYVVTPESQDVRLEDVVAYIRAMEEAGMVEIRER